MQKYFIEAWALGMFMCSACLFAVLLETPGQSLHTWIPDPFTRRWLMGLAMGLTAVILIYSDWGKRSGAHMNPAVTLAFWYLGRLDRRDLPWYIAAQFFGGALAMLLIRLLFFQFVPAPSVNFVQTQPGMAGWFIAFLLEVLLAFVLILVVLYSSNDARTAPYTGVFAGLLVMLYIAIEAPYSGMSINPARTFASALAAGNFRYLWLYFLAPTLGMFLAAVVWKTLICRNPDFKCSLHG
ncbi:MAG: aquaporin [Saprospiraceae bacterium]|nr:aquaporin [Saprospiraceae bacterium]